MSSARPECIPRNNVVACDLGDDTATRGKAMVSEYTTKYLIWPAQAKEPIRPPSNGELSYDASAKHDMKTMYGEAYVGHPIPARTQCVRVPQNQQDYKQVKLDCLSTYNENFRNTNGLVQRTKPFHPRIDYGRFGMQGAVETLSVSHQTYRLYTVEELTAAKRNPVITKPERDGAIPVTDRTQQVLTTVQESFKCPGQPARRQLIIPSSTHVHSDRNCRMDMQTTNQRDFGYKFRESTPPAPALIREKGFRYFIKVDPFACRTTFQDDYIRHASVRRPKSFKPIQCHVASKTPFQEQTLYRDDYKRLPYQVRPKPYRLEENLHLPKSFHFKGTTHYADEFTRASKNCKRRELLKPKTTRSSKGRFNGETSYNVDFVKHDLSKINQQSYCKPDKTYKQPKIPFQVQSTAHSHYRGVRAPPSKICKPVTNPRIHGSYTSVC